MGKLRFHGVVLLNLTLFAVILAQQGLLATSKKLGRSNGKDFLPQRHKFKDFTPPEDNCYKIDCKRGDDDDCGKSGCGGCMENLDNCSFIEDQLPEDECSDVECTPGVAV